jgi:hypothetical protein
MCSDNGAQKPRRGARGQFNFFDEREAIGSDRSLSYRPVCGARLYDFVTIVEAAYNETVPYLSVNPGSRSTVNVMRLPYHRDFRPARSCKDRNRWDGLPAPDTVRASVSRASAFR